MLKAPLWWRGALYPVEVDRLRGLGDLDQRPGVRIAAGDPLVRAVAESGVSRRIAARWPGMRPVRIVSFDKSARVNWGVPWHQDRVIAVADRIDVAGFGNWSRKGDIWHCEPPEAVLRGMLFVRLHLDPAPPESGPMEIAIGASDPGPLEAAAVERLAEAGPVEATVAEAGDVLLLPMLIPHRSAPASADAPRRVLRVDYAAGALPGGLAWAMG